MINNFSQVLSRTLTAEFYRVNAMFFLVVIGFCFGFMRGAEHIALAGMFVSSPWLAMIPIGVWIFYTIKVILYNKREVKFERNWFLYSLPLTNALPAYATVAAGQLGPAIGYGSLLITMALKFEQWIELTMIIASLIVLIIITAWRLHRSLVYPHKEKSTPLPVRKFDQLFAKPISWIFVEGILRSQPGMIYVTKFAACIVLFGVTQLYLYEEYDARLYLMGACVAFSANLALVFQYQRFEIESLAIFRSLPISFAKRMSTFVITMAVLCFPEIAMLFTNLPANLSVIDYLYAILFGISLLIAGYGPLYSSNNDFESFTRIIFFISMGLLLLILFGVPVLIMALVLSASGIIIIKRSYYAFHP